MENQNAWQKVSELGTPISQNGITPVADSLSAPGIYVDDAFSVPPLK